MVDADLSLEVNRVLRVKIVELLLNDTSVTSPQSVLRNMVQEIPTIHVRVDVVRVIWIVDTRQAKIVEEIPRRKRNINIKRNTEEVDRGPRNDECGLFVYYSIVLLSVLVIRNVST